MTSQQVSVRAPNPARTHTWTCLVFGCAVGVVLLLHWASDVEDQNPVVEAGRQLVRLNRVFTNELDHKPLLPLNKDDYIGLSLAALGLIVAAAGGIGGGGFLVPLYVLVFRFSPKMAIPLSNVTILGGAVTNTLMNLKKRHPYADRPLVDWDLILVMEPLTIGGAVVGSFFNKVLPAWILAAGLIILLVVTAQRTLTKGKKVFDLETKAKKRQALEAAQEAQDAQTWLVDETVGDYGSVPNGHLKPPSWHSSSNRPSHNSQREEDLDDPRLLFGVENGIVSNYWSTPSNSNHTTPRGSLQDGGGSKKNSFRRKPSAQGEDFKDQEHGLGKSVGDRIREEGNGSGDEDELEDLRDRERDTPPRKVLALAVIFLVVLAVNVLKGGGAFRSPVGIRCGSPAFWGATVFILLWCAASSLPVRAYLIRQWRTKERIGYDYAPGDVLWDPVATVKYPCISFFAGFCAGLFGIGGGIVKGPLMLEMGVDPMVAAATSGCMILFTSFTATASFVVFGLLQFDYAILLVVLGVIATAVGQVGANYLVNKYQRASFIILTIGAIVAISAVAMGVQSLHTVVTAQTEGPKGICFGDGGDVR